MNTKLMHPRNTSISQIQRIIELVAQEWGVTKEILLGRVRTQNIAFPRQVAMTLSREHTGLSLQDIGLAFGGRDHGTVIHAKKVVTKAIQGDKVLARHIQNVVDKLNVEN